MARKLAMITLGCPKNTVDSEVMLGNLARTGFEITEDCAGADIVLVNTCGFIEAAKAESIDTVLQVARLKESGSLKGLFVVGCLAQRYPGELSRELPEVDGIIGFASYARLPEILEAHLRRRGSPSRPTVLVGDSTVPFRPEWERRRIGPRHSAFLRVAEGCDHTCTFCAIPSFRGRFRSKPWDALLDEARRLVGGGVREICLIAEDTNQYGQDLREGKGLADLLGALSSLAGVDWIRILYAYPAYFGDDLVDAIASIPQVVKYIDIPLQHIADPVLRRMRRPPRGKTEDLLRRLRERIQGLALRTTFITGFPGETEEDHEDLVEFVQAFRFERLGVFPYSPEDGTPAGTCTDQIPQDVREARANEIMAVQQDIAFEFARSLVGRTFPVLVDARENGAALARTPLDAPEVDPIVRIDEAGAAFEPGALVPARMIASTGYDLVGVHAPSLASGT